MNYRTFSIRIIGRLDPIEVVAIGFESAKADVMAAYAGAEIQSIYMRPEA